MCIKIRREYDLPFIQLFPRMLDIRGPVYEIAGMFAGRNE